MESIARNQFPIIVWREGEKLLWNPIHRKALKNRPEERVRLRIIEYLLQAGWSKHRITTEEAIKDYSASNLRTDIICYNQGFEPQILAECKAENITLTTKTAEQVSRYNQNVQAPYLLISNGMQDRWYNIDTDKGKVRELEAVPGLLSKPDANSRDFDYWKERGFAGSKALPGLRRWLEPKLQLFRADRENSIRYLQFKKSPSDLSLDHYYLISSFDQHNIALSFLNTPFGGSRLIAILNINGENRAVAEVNLDLVFDKKKPNTSIYSVDGIENIDFKKEAGELLEKRSSDSLKAISIVMNDLFEKYLHL